MDGFSVPSFNGGRDSVHRHDAAHEGGVNSNSEVVHEDSLICDFANSDLVLERGDVFIQG